MDRGRSCIYISDLNDFDEIVFLLLRQAFPVPSDDLTGIVQHYLEPGKVSGDGVERLGGAPVSSVTDNDRRELDQLMSIADKLRASQA